MHLKMPGAGVNESQVMAVRWETDGAGSSFMNNWKISAERCWIWTWTTTDSSKSELSGNNNNEMITSVRQLIFKWPSISRQGVCIERDMKRLAIIYETFLKEVFGNEQNTAYYIKTNCCTSCWGTQIVILGHLRFHFCTATFFTAAECTSNQKKRLLPLALSH